MLGQSFLGLHKSKIVCSAGYTVPQSTPRLAMADFWCTFPHDGRNSLGWWGWGVHTPTPFHSVNHHVLEVYAPAERADTLSLFRLYLICTLCTVHTPPPPKYFIQVSAPIVWNLLCWGQSMGMPGCVGTRQKKVYTHKSHEWGRDGGEGREREKKEESCLSLDLSSCPPAAPFLYLYTVQQREVKRRTGPVVFAFFIF